MVVDHVTADPGVVSLFNLGVEELDASGDVIASETFRNISTVVGHPRYAETVINDGSTLVAVTTSAGDGDAPTDGTYTAGGTPDDGGAISDTEILGDRDAREGIYALEGADLFNLLCIPPLDEETDVAETTWDDAAIYCQERRAIVIIDPRAEWEEPVADTISNAEGVLSSWPEIGSVARSRA